MHTFGSAATNTITVEGWNKDTPDGFFAAGVVVAATPAYELDHHSSSAKGASSVNRLDLTNDGTTYNSFDVSLGGVATAASFTFTVTNRSTGAAVTGVSITFTALSTGSYSAAFNLATVPGAVGTEYNVTVKATGGPSTPLTIYIKK
jgi:hypothetical protein